MDRSYNLELSLQLYIGDLPLELVSSAACQAARFYLFYIGVLYIYYLSCERRPAFCCIIRVDFHDTLYRRRAVGTFEVFFMRVVFDDLYLIIYARPATTRVDCYHRVSDA